MQEVTSHAKFGEDTLFVFLAPRPSCTARPTATNEGSKRVSPANGVPFGVLTMKNNLMVKTSKNVNFGGLNRRFEPNLQKF